MASTVDQQRKRNVGVMNASIYGAHEITAAGRHRIGNDFIAMTSKIVGVAVGKAEISSVGFYRFCCPSLHLNLPL